MAFSTFLNDSRPFLKALVKELKKDFDYVGILGTDVRAKRVSVNSANTSISDGNSLDECGFVIKLHSGGAFYEYSFDVLTTPEKVADDVRRSLKIAPALKGKTISCPVPKDEPLIKSFSRENDFAEVTNEQMTSFAADLVKKAMARDKEHVKNAFVSLAPYTINKLFISANRELDQTFSWVNGYLMLTYADGKMVLPRAGENGCLIKEVMEKLPSHIDGLIKKGAALAKAKPIEPGVYDVITDPDMTGLIAHEAFGHGVEMDQFVKDRALAKSYMNKYVASPISNMRDGAAATISCASYFFDDDGVLAQNTQIIKDGILVSGISDLTSACQLGTAPTGNGRRESFKRKAYTRMTNTFFDGGTDKLEDMIASIKHGYFLCEMNNGMEDPKNWNIQCTAEYGIEIIDGKLTENYVSPVVISGSVPELLKSISMISGDVEVIGSGGCGKGYKEWVRVSSGGPHIKARAKLG